MLKSLIITSFIVTSINSFSLTSKSTIKGTSAKDLQEFLATPTNWPNFVASSLGVAEADVLSTPMKQGFFSPKAKPTNAIDKPLKKGDRVKEIFGLPPILPLAVTWTCQENTVKKGKMGAGGTLEFFSPEGLAGVAENCRMSFEIGSDGDDDSTLAMTVEIDPVSPLANFAGPILKIDNDLALKALLPLAIKNSKKSKI